MEDFVLPQGTNTLKDSRELLNNALLTVRSLSSGTSFPTSNLTVGMLCYRTDQNRLYQLTNVESQSWTDKIQMNINGSSASCTGNAATATRATNADNSNRATTADECTGNAATATRATADENGNNIVETYATKQAVDNVSSDVSAGFADVETRISEVEENISKAGVPVGFEYFTTNPNVPVGSLPLIGGTYSRTAYADLWEWVQSQTGYLITESEWQTKSSSNGGNVPFYSSGDGSTTFRVPSLKCWIRGASGIEEVGSYLKAGLPNITGAMSIPKTDNAQELTGASDTGALYRSGSGSTKAGGSTTTTAVRVNFNASKSNSIYGASTTVQPPSIVGMWCVKAFGTVSNVGNQDLAEISENFARIEEKVTSYADDVTYIDAFIVETWKSGSLWGRKWSNGFIEQGGYQTNNGNEAKTITFHFPFSTSSYHFFRSPRMLKASSGTYYCVGYQTKTTTAVTFQTDTTSYYTAYDWYACGF